MQFSITSLIHVFVQVLQICELCTMPTWESRFAQGVVLTMRFLLLTLVVKTATIMAAVCFMGNQVCGPIPTYLGKTVMLWLGSKAPSKADIAIIIECNNFYMMIL